MTRARSLKELASLLAAELHGDPEIRIGDVAELSTAGPGEIALWTDPRRLEEAAAARAGALLVPRHHPALEVPQLVCREPPVALARLVELFRPPPPARIGVDPMAVLAVGADVHPEAWIGPFVYIGPEAVIGAGTAVEPFTCVGPRARIGAGCTLGPGATVGPSCVIGDETTIGPGAVVGYRGFGFWRDGDAWRPIRSAGTVAIGDGVEIGANSCVDRGTLGATRVGDGAKIDNLVQVGHNVTVAARAMLCAQVGLAGSARVGEGAILAGQVGVADHRRIGRGARVGAHSGVAHDVPDGGDASGYPAFEHRRWLRASALFKGLADLARQVRDLARQVRTMQENENERD